MKNSTRQKIVALFVQIMKDVIEIAYKRDGNSESMENYIENYALKMREKLMEIVDSEKVT